MAQRRMFSLKIVGSDVFLDMPTSSRELYFQLGMYADDDGFINPRKIMRMAGASEDDLKVLLTKRFVLPFENGVVVIKHWLINNLVRKDWYQPTIYSEERKMIKVKENGAYTESVNKLLTQYRLGKDRIGKDNTEGTISNEIESKEVKELISLFQEVNPSYQVLFARRNQKEAIVRMLKIHGAAKLREMIEVLPKIITMPYAPKATTPLELERDMGKLKAFAEQQRNKEKQKVAENKIKVAIID